MSSIGKRLIKTYHKRLKATYLQAPHHGNNDKRESFFKYIHAKVTFIDAPSFLRKRDTVKKKYKGFKKIWMKKSIRITAENAALPSANHPKLRNAIEHFVPPVVE